jgi:hypothetical protein
MLQTLEIVLTIFKKKSLQYIGSDRPSIDPKEKKKKKKPCHMLCALISLKFTDHENLNQ